MKTDDRAGMARPSGYRQCMMSMCQPVDDMESPTGCGIPVCGKWGLSAVSGDFVEHSRGHIMEIRSRWTMQWIPNTHLEPDDAAEGFPAFHRMERLFRLIQGDNARDHAVEIELSLGVPVGQQGEGPREETPFLEA
jgi:hypothetical protein